jgi:SOS response regulatory protein OraA/RecX
VKVELDGAPWRTVPVEVVLAAGLHVGLVLDRQRLRVIRRELRSREAMTRASRLLSRRDLTEQGLDAELRQRKVAPAARRATVTRLRQVGAVDDRRLAHRRAEVLAARCAGDLLIRADLESRGVAPELVEAAIAALPAERDRVRTVLAVRGPGPATARYLARKGFGEDAIEAALEGSIAQSG